MFSDYNSLLIIIMKKVNIFRKLKLLSSFFNIGNFINYYFYIKIITPSFIQLYIITRFSYKQENSFL